MELETSEAMAGDTPIWRYMDLPKFVSMLATGFLWFSRAAALRDDPYEAFCRAVPRAMPSDEHGPKWILHQDHQGPPQTVSAERMIAEISRLSADYCEAAREHLYVNSWCLAGESMAMWEIYGSRGCGVAVKSSIGQYQQAAKFSVPKSHYTFGAVEYHVDLMAALDVNLDFSQGPVPVPGPSLWEKMLKLGFHKRVCYEYEKEWRAALYQDHRPEIAGIGVEFDLDKLLTAVHIGPRSEEFFFEVVLSIMNKFGLRKPLERSFVPVPTREATSAS